MSNVICLAKKRQELLLENLKEYAQKEGSGIKKPEKVLTPEQQKQNRKDEQERINRRTMKLYKIKRGSV